MRNARLPDGTLRDSSIMLRIPRASARVTDGAFDISRASAESHGAEKHLAETLNATIRCASITAVPCNATEGEKERARQREKGENSLRTRDNKRIDVDARNKNAY